MALRGDHNFPYIFVQNAFSFSFPCRKTHVIEKPVGSSLVSELDLDIISSKKDTC